MYIAYGTDVNSPDIATTNLHLDSSDASGNAMGAVLQQVVDQSPEPLFFFSRAFDQKQISLDIYLKELLAVYSAVKRLNSYIYGNRLAFNKGNLRVSALIHKNMYH